MVNYIFYITIKIFKKSIKNSNNSSRPEIINNSTGIMKQFHDFFHTKHCNNNTVCELSTSPYSYSCIIVKPNQDMNYAIIIKRYVKLTNILQFILSVIIVLKASNMLKYKQFVFIPLLLFSGMFLGYLLSLNDTINRNDFIGIALNHIIVKKSVIDQYFDFTDFTSIMCFVVIVCVIAIIVSMDFVYLWIIRYFGLILMFNSLSSVFYGVVTSLSMLAFVIVRDYFKQ